MEVAPTCTKEKLEPMYKRIQPVTPAMAKHQLVKIVAEDWSCASNDRCKLTVQWKLNSFTYIHSWSKSFNYNCQNEVYYYTISWFCSNWI